MIYHNSFSEDIYHNFDWMDFYKEVDEDIPVDSPDQCGKEIVIDCFVNKSHSADKVTRRSHTGILTLINKAPIVFYSK